VNHSRAKISVVINNYNYERYLADAIESALGQTYADCEVIVVDDGSTDGSRQLIEEYGDRVEVIFKENGGQASAFNVGIEAAKGEYILLLDADDVLERYAVERSVAAIDETAIRLSYRLLCIDGEGQANGLFAFGGPSHFIGTLKDAILTQHFFPSTPTSGNLFRASALKAILPVPEDRFRICADSYIFIQTSYAGAIQLIPDQLGRYRIHGKNHYVSTAGRRRMTDGQLAARVNSNFAVWELLLEYGRHFIKENPDALVRAVQQRESLRLISEAKRRGLEMEELDQWTQGHLIRSMFYCIKKVRRLRGLLAWFWSLIELIRNAIGRGRSISSI
jgi:glycosyltransferase involved in cell wall biosynthesis